MTGFATATSEPSLPVAGALHEPAAGAPRAGAAKTAGAPVTVELRSVNNRFLDLTLRVPDSLRHLEPVLRERATARLRRGKVELKVSVASPADEAPGLQAPGAEQLARLLAVQQAVRELLPDARPFSVEEALRLGRGSEPPREASPEAALAVADRALAALVEARAREGERLADWMRERTAALRALAERAEPLVPAAVDRQRQRFIERWREALAAGAANGGSVDPQAAAERALAEAAAYAIRLDVGEELGRLRSHLDEIDRLLAKGGEVGKRLEFLIQELLREANTLGSKSSSLELTGIAVDMKVAIEQLREQVQNLE